VGSLGSVCLILAGGFGTRLRSVLGTKPKCLAPVGSTSFLEIQLRQLKKSGFERFILCLGFGANEVIAAAQRLNAEEFALEFSVENFPLGTGGAIRKAMVDFSLEQAVVVNGDTFFSGPLDDFSIPIENESTTLVRIGVAESDNYARYGSLAIDADDRVCSFVEKGTKNFGFINAGIMRICKNSFEGFDSLEKLSIEHDILPSLAKSGLVQAIFLNGSILDIGVPDDYGRFVRDFVSRE
jgi:D-glycero-alpha-D-manno-heptose 1-phosphate guanylyltransferase